MTPTQDESNKLFRISSPSEFDKWIKAFIKVLRYNNLGHLIPSKIQQSINPSQNEANYIETIFNSFVPVDAYPKWFQEELDQDYLTLVDVILNAIMKVTIEKFSLPNISNPTNTTEVTISNDKTPDFLSGNTNLGGTEKIDPFQSLKGVQLRKRKPMANKR